MNKFLIPLTVIAVTVATFLGVWFVVSQSRNGNKLATKEIQAGRDKDESIDDASGDSASDSQSESDSNVADVVPIFGGINWPVSTGTDVTGETGYAIEISAIGPKTSGVQERPEWTGTVLLKEQVKPTHLKVERRINSGMTKVVLPSVEFGTGLMTGEKTVIVPSQLIEKAQMIGVSDGDVFYAAYVAESNEQNQLTRLNVGVLAAPKVKVDHFIELSKSSKDLCVAWINASGKLELVMNVPAGSMKTTGLISLKKKLPKGCVGGVVFQHWGNASAMIVDSASSYSQVAPVVQGISQELDQVFDLNSRNQFGDWSAAKNYISKRLVQIRVMRSSNTAKRQFSYQTNVEFRDPGKNRQSHPEKYASNKGAFTVDRERNISHLNQELHFRQMPFYLGAFCEIPFSSRRPEGESSWQDVESCRFTDQGINKGRTSKKLEQAKRTESFQVLEEDEQKASVRMSIQVESVAKGYIPNVGGEPPNSQMGFDAKIPIQINVEGLLEIEKSSGMCNNIDMAGVVQSGSDSGKPETTSFKLMVRQLEKSELVNYAPVWRPELDRTAVESSELTPADVEIILKGLRSTNSSSRADARKMLNDFDPEKNEDISHALALFFTRDGRTKSYREAAGNWVQAQHVDDLLSAWKASQEHCETAIWVLQRSDATESHDLVLPVIEFAFDEAKDMSVEAERLLRERYPALIEQVVFPRFTIEYKDRGLWQMMRSVALTESTKRDEAFASLKFRIQEEKEDFDRRFAKWLDAIDEMVAAFAD